MWSFFFSSGSLNFPLNHLKNHARAISQGLAPSSQTNRSLHDCFAFRMPQFRARRILSPPVLAGRCSQAFVKRRKTELISESLSTPAESVLTKRPSPRQNGKHWSCTLTLYSPCQGTHYNVDILYLLTAVDSVN